MNYNRYLDLHLCTSAISGDFKGKKREDALRKDPQQGEAKWKRKFFTRNGIEYFYEFRKDMDDQARYRTAKSEGFTYDPDAWWGKGNCRNFCDVEITTANVSMLTCKGPPNNREISDELKQMRYIGCMASIEQLKKEDLLYPNLEGLVRWITDETTTNKLRINCHGTGRTVGGFKMGDAELSPQELIHSLVRHGLTRGEKVTQNTFGLPHAARWKLDSEVTLCENAACGTLFERTIFSSNKHHCRRCGGIFCNECTSKRIDLRVALTGPNKGTANNVKNARVCDRCFAVVHAGDGSRAAVGSELKYGLQTIALGLCMGARAGNHFSPQIKNNSGGGAAGTLEAGSLACRIRDELTHQVPPIRGVKITASNTIVRNEAGVGLVNDFRVEYPGNGGTKMEVDLTQSGTLAFPAFIYGSDIALRTRYRNLPDPKPASRILVKGRTIYFGYAEPLPQHPRPPSGNLRASGQLPPPTCQQMEDQLRPFFDKWEFKSCHSIRGKYPSIVNGPIDQTCWMLTPPPRVGSIWAEGNMIFVEGRKEDTFKLTKSYGVS